MRVAVTGGAGFIGSHLVDSLMADPTISLVRVIDNFSSGRLDFLSHHQNIRKLDIRQRDLVSSTDLVLCFDGIDAVYHLSANPDARLGIADTRLDLEQETIATYNVLEAMRIADVRRIIFSSSGTVYGDLGERSASETYGPYKPISLYGAGKAASETLISAFCGTFNFCAIVIRFGNVVGERTTHGVIFDLIGHLKRDTSVLPVLGNGRQAKPYVYVRELVAGLRFCEGLLVKSMPGEYDIYNLAPDGATSVRYIASTLLATLGLRTTTVSYEHQDRGWPGDIPHSRIDSSKLRAEGFSLTLTSNEAVDTAVAAIVSDLKLDLVNVDRSSL